MSAISPLTYKIVAHATIPEYNTDEAVDWAIEMMRLGYDSEYILILAGLSKPTNRFETARYIDAALTELDLEPKTGQEAIVSYSYYYINQIANGIRVKYNLAKVCDLCIQLDMERSIFDFYLLHWAWTDIDWPNNNGLQWYWDGADKDNIEQITIDTAKKWLVDNNLWDSNAGFRDGPSS